MSSATCFNLDQSKILSSANELNPPSPPFFFYLTMILNIPSVLAEIFIFVKCPFIFAWDTRSVLEVQLLSLAEEMKWVKKSLF